MYRARTKFVLSPTGTVSHLCPGHELLGLFYTKGSAPHGAFCIAYYWLAHCHTFGDPRRRFRLHPIQSFETGLKFVDWLNRSIGPFGLYFPILAIFKNHTKYRSSRRHVFTYPHMMARRE
jgi:hypothetical protein